MISPDELSKPSTKGDLKKLLAKHEDEIPALAEITTEMTRDEMEKQAKAAIDAYDPTPQEMTSEEKSVAFDRLAEKKPDAVLVPATQALFRLRRPETGEQFEVSIFGGEHTMGSRHRNPDEVARKWRTPEDQNRKPSYTTPHATPIGEVPSWARSEVYDLVDSGAIRLLASEEEATEIGRPPANEQPILDNPTASTGPRLTYTQALAMNDDQPGVAVEIGGNFKRPEQEAAWNVINETIQSEKPLPKTVTSDPKDAGEEEISHVERRLRRCLEAPHAFLTTRSQRSTQWQDRELRAFFSQLLEIEYNGWTPKRSPAGNQWGGTRPAIINAIRRVASDYGYEVVGDYVRAKSQSELDDSSFSMPSESFGAQTPVTW